MSELDNNFQNETESVVSIKEWLIALIIMVIPLVNIIMMFVWAFNGTNKSKSNFFKAALIVSAISIVLLFIFGGLITAFFMSIMDSSYSTYY